MNVSLTNRLGLLYTIAFTVSRENGFVNYDFQELTLILGFCPLKMVTMDLFPKTIAYLNSYRNARITTIFESVDKLDYTYFVQYFTLVITNFNAPLDFSAPKKLSLEGDWSPYPPPSSHHATDFHYILHDRHMILVKNVGKTVMYIIGNLPPV